MRSVRCAGWRRTSSSPAGERCCGWPQWCRPCARAARRHRPPGAHRRPAVHVLYENRGLTEHIKDVTRRLAAAGYIGLAVDLLSRIGGTSAVSDSAEVPGILGNTPPDQFLSAFVSAGRWVPETAYV